MFGLGEHIFSGRVPSWQKRRWRRSGGAVGSGEISDDDDDHDHDDDHDDEGYERAGGGGMGAMPEAACESAVRSHYVVAVHFLQAAPLASTPVAAALASASLDHSSAAAAAGAMVPSVFSSPRAIGGPFASSRCLQQQRSRRRRRSSTQCRR